MTIILKYTQYKYMEITMTNYTWSQQNNSKNILTFKKFQLTVLTSHPNLVKSPFFTLKSG